MKTPWYKSTGGIIALLVLFFPAGIFLMWKYSNWKMWLKVALSVVAAIIVISAMSSSGSSSTSSTSSSNSTHETTAKSVSEPTATPKPLTMQDKLYKITDSLQLQRDATKISYDASTGKVMVTYNIAKHWGDTHLGDLTPVSLLNTEVNDYVSFAGQMFKLDGITTVGADYQTSFTDQYGNAKLDDAWKFSMDKTTFDKFNWKNLENQPIFDTLVDNTSENDDYYIAPSIQAALNEAGHDQVKLGKITW